MAKKAKKSKESKAVAKTDAEPAPRIDKIPGDALARACGLLDLVPTVLGFPQSTFIGIRSTGGTMRLSLSSAVTAIVPVPCGLELAPGKSLDRRILFPFVRPGGDYGLRISDDRWVLQHGRRRAELQSVPTNWGYGEWDTSKARAIDLPEGIENLLRAGLLCAASDPMTPQLNVVQLEIGSETVSMACDNLTLSRARIAEDRPPKDSKGKGKTKSRKSKGAKSEAAPKASERILIPAALIEPMIAEKARRILVDETTVGFEVGGARIWAQLAEKARTAFPAKALTTVIDQGRNAEPILTCKSSDLSELCRVFAGYLGSIPSPEWEVEFRTTGMMAEAYARTPYAEFHDGLDAEIHRDASVTTALGSLRSVVNFLAGRESSIRIVLTDRLFGVVTDSYEFFFSRKAEAAPKVTRMGRKATPQSNETEMA